MDTLQSVVDATTSFVPCQYPERQNSGRDIIMVVNLSLQSTLAYSVDGPPGSEFCRRVFAPLHHPLSDPHHVFLSCTHVEESKSLGTRAPPLC